MTGSTGAVSEARPPQQQKRKPHKTDKHLGGKPRKTVRRRTFPYLRVATLWAKGKTIAEIAKAVGYVGKGDDPFHSLRVVLTRMHQGYKGADGKVVKLPHRISRETVARSRKAGLRAKRR